MIIPAVAVTAAIAMGPFAGPGMSHAPTGTEMSGVATQAAVPVKRHTNECWGKKRGKHGCVSPLGGYYLPGYSGQTLTSGGNGYALSGPGEAMAPVDGGYVSTPSGTAMAPVVGGYVSTPSGTAMQPVG